VKNRYDPFSFLILLAPKVSPYVEMYHRQPKTIDFGQIQRQLLLYFT
jgi:hypothetical protein